MKIGILTFHRAINFGAVLQCYALYRTLSDMGHEVEVIDYRPAYIEKYRKPLYWNDFKKQALLSKIKTLLLLPLTYINKRKAARVFDSFVNHYISTTTLVKNISEIPHFEVVFFGSDQIWNPRICEGFDPFYWGQFNKKNTKFISYAASLGTPQVLTNKQWNQICPLAKSFDLISVRESKSAEYLHAIGINAKTVLDPTLIVSKDIFESIVERPRESNYVLLYMLESDSHAVEFASNLAKQHNLKLIRVRALSSPDIRKKTYKEVIPNSVGEFLGYFKYADYVVNVSFHGTVFSLIFNKNFYTIKSKNFERAYGLLESLNLLSLLISSDKDIMPTQIDYTNVLDKLSILKNYSLSYIRNSLK